MATGWPMKTTYADGDVYSAQDVNDITGTINLLGSSVAYTAGKNILNNAASQIWQRGTSITGTTTSFCADRWQAYRVTTGSTFSRQATSDTTNLPFIQYCIRVQRNNTTTATQQIYLSQTVETLNAVPMAGKTVAVSFYARKGANFSAASNNINVYLDYGTGTDQNVFVGFTGAANVLTSTATLTATWQRFTFTATVPSTATELAFYTSYTPVGTAGAADYYEITGQQLEQGSTATAFATTSGNSIAGELAICQRYLPSIYVGSSGGEVANGYAALTNTPVYTANLPVTARIAPTGITVSGTFNGYVLNNGYAATLLYNGGGLNTWSVYTTSITITAGEPSRLIGTAGAYILFTGCEL
jgi:hypothetical protein